MFNLRILLIENAHILISIISFLTAQKRAPSFMLRAGNLPLQRQSEIFQAVFVDLEITQKAFNGTLFQYCLKVVLSSKIYDTISVFLQHISSKLV